MPLPHPARLQSLWRCGGAVLALGLMVALVPPAAQAATIDVPCSNSAALIASVTAANAAAGPTTIRLRNQPRVAGCTFNLTAPSTPGSENGLPQITGVLTVAGVPGGSTIARKPNAPEFRIVEVASSGNLTLDRVVVTGGRVHGNGGGIFVNDGAPLTLTRSTVTKNTAVDNPVLSFGELATEGGGIASDGGVTTLTDSTVSENRAISSAGSSVGGGIINTHATLIIRRSRLTGNHAISKGFPGSFGGALTSVDGVSPVTIEDSVIADNTAEGPTAVGGALELDRMSTIVRSSILANRTIATNVGLVTCPLESGFFITECNTGSAFAGAAVWNQGTLSMLDTLIVGNTSTATGTPHPVVEGAGLTNTGSYNPRPPGNPVPGRAELTRSSIIGNTARAVGPGSEVRGAGIANQDGIVENQRGPGNPPGSSFLKLHASLILGNRALASVTHGGGIYNYVNQFLEHGTFEAGGGRSQQAITLDGGTKVVGNTPSNCEQHNGAVLPGC